MVFFFNAVLAYDTLHTKETKFPQGFRNTSMKRKKIRKTYKLLQ